MVKSPKEISAVRRAVDATMKSLRRVAGDVGAGVSERALAGSFEAECKRQGAPRLAFDSIVKSGPNSLWPWRILASHYERRDRALADGELVIFDVGCEVGHYASDLGRTFPVSGTFSEEQKETLQMVTAVTDAIIAAIRPGMSFAQLKEVAVAATPEAERRYMQTGLFFGHHIGLNVGDPSLAEATLEPGMIFTVEPWYYNHDREIAVFLEENVLVTEDGCENLSRGLARTPEALEELMRGGS